MSPTLVSLFTESSIAATQSPALSTQSPALSTQSPALSTQSPALSTQSPALCLHLHAEHQRRYERIKAWREAQSDPHFSEVPAQWLREFREKTD